MQYPWTGSALNRHPGNQKKCTNNISSWLRWNWHLSGCVDFWQTDIRTNELKDWRQTVSSRYLDDWTRKYVIHQVILLLLSYLVEQSLAFESIVMSILFSKWV
jgi:hypothetical protein